MEQINTLELNKIYNGDALEVLRMLPDKSINCCITSPPYYGLRDYGVSGQIGLEDTPEKYIEKLVEIFREVKRILKNDGTLWLNIGDSYAGSNQGAGAKNQSGKQMTNKGTNFMREQGFQSKISKVNGCKPKDLIGIPWLLAFSLRLDGWYLRQDIIWAKPNPMPESVKDRCTKSHEYIFLFSKSQRYYFDSDSIKEIAVSQQRKREKGNGESAVDTKLRGHNGCCGVVSNYKNKRSVWTVSTKSYKGAHFAVFPEELIKPCVLAGCPAGGIVIDPFFGSGTTGKVAMDNNRNYIGIDLNKQYCDIAEKRIAEDTSQEKYL